jgi:hypothetical protein
MAIVLRDKDQMYVVRKDDHIIKECETLEEAQAAWVDFLEGKIDFKDEKVSCECQLPENCIVCG